MLSESSSVTLTLEAGIRKNVDAVMNDVQHQSLLEQGVLLKDACICFRLKSVHSASTFIITLRVSMCP